MALDPKEIEKMFLKLAPDEQKEVVDFIQFLETKHQNTSNKKEKMTFEWEGALSHLKDKYTSVELQHKINDWRIEELD